MDDKNKDEENEPTHESALNESKKGPKVNTKSRLFGLIRTTLEKSNRPSNKETKNPFEEKECSIAEQSDRSQNSCKKSYHCHKSEISNEHHESSISHNRYSRSQSFHANEYDTVKNYKNPLDRDSAESCIYASHKSFRNTYSEDNWGDSQHTNVDRKSGSDYEPPENLHYSNVIPKRTNLNSRKQFSSTPNYNQYNSFGNQNISATKTFSSVIKNKNLVGERNDSSNWCDKNEPIIQNVDAEGNWGDVLSSGLDQNWCTDSNASEKSKISYSELNIKSVDMTQKGIVYNSPRQSIPLSKCNNATHAKSLQNNNKSSYRAFPNIPIDKNVFSEKCDQSSWCDNGDESVVQNVDLQGSWGDVVPSDSLDQNWCTDSNRLEKSQLSYSELNSKSEERTQKGIVYNNPKQSIAVSKCNNAKSFRNKKESNYRAFPNIPKDKNVFSEKCDQSNRDNNDESVVQNVDPDGSWGDIVPSDGLDQNWCTDSKSQEKSKHSYSELNSKSEERTPKDILYNNPIQSIPVSKCNIANDTKRLQSKNKSSYRVFPNTSKDNLFSEQCDQNNWCIKNDEPVVQNADPDGSWGDVVPSDSLDQNWCADSKPQGISKHFNQVLNSRSNSNAPNYGRNNCSVNSNIANIYDSKQIPSFSKQKFISNWLSGSSQLSSSYSKNDESILLPKNVNSEGKRTDFNKNWSSGPVSHQKLESKCIAQAQKTNFGTSMYADKELNQCMGKSDHSNWYDKSGKYLTPLAQVDKSDSNTYADHSVKKQFTKQNFQEECIKISPAISHSAKRINKVNLEDSVNSNKRSHSDNYKEKNYDLNSSETESMSNFEEDESSHQVKCREIHPDRIAEEVGDSLKITRLFSASDSSPVFEDNCEEEDIINSPKLNLSINVNLNKQNKLTKDSCPRQVSVHKNKLSNKCSSMDKMHNVRPKSHNAAKDKGPSTSDNNDASSDNSWEDMSETSEVLDDACGGPSQSMPMSKCNTANQTKSLQNKNKTSYRAFQNTPKNYLLGEKCDQSNWCKKNDEHVQNVDPEGSLGDVVSSADLGQNWCTDSNPLQKSKQSCPELNSKSGKGTQREIICNSPGQSIPVSKCNIAYDTKRLQSKNKSSYRVFPNTSNDNLFSEQCDQNNWCNDEPVVQNVDPDGSWGDVVPSDSLDQNWCPDSKPQRISKHFNPESYQKLKSAYTDKGQKNHVVDKLKSRREPFV